jgi:hypothetical protein
MSATVDRRTPHPAPPLVSARRRRPRPAPGARRHGPRRPGARRPRAPRARGSELRPGFFLSSPSSRPGDHDAKLLHAPGFGRLGRQDRGGCCVAAKEAPLFSQASASETFAHGAFAGRTIGDVAAGLRSGATSPSELPVEVIRRGGETLALNTRSTLALRRAGVDRADWVIRDATGNPAAERLLTQRLARNGMPSGSGVIRITGAGRYASSIR